MPQVRAIREGFYGSQVRRPGQVFNFDVKLMKKDPKTGKALLPSWVEDAEKPAPKPAKEPEKESAPDKGEQVI